MSDQLTAGGGPLTRAIAGQQVTFAELSFYDRRELLKEFRQQQRLDLKALLTDSGMTPDQIYMEMRTFDDEIVGDNIWFKFFNSDDGKLKILEKSLSLGGANPQLARKYGGDDLAHLCGAITHTPVGPIGGNKPNPQKAPPTDAKAFGQD
jgi:hypothetical protein